MSVAISEKVNQYVRSTYYTSSTLKSSSKTRAGEFVSPDVINDIISCQDSRLYSAGRRIFYYQLFDTIFTQFFRKYIFLDNVATSISIGLSKCFSARNCQQLSLLAYDYAIHSQGEKAFIGSLNQNHTVCFMGEDAEKMQRYLEFRMQNLRNFRSLYVCDPWANIVCTPGEYNDLFRQKMLSWKSKGKFVFNSANQSWVNPVEDEYINLISNATWTVTVTYTMSSFIRNFLNIAGINH